MKRSGFKFGCLFICLIILNHSYAQEKGVSTVDSLDKAFLNWYNLDPVSDKVQGAAINRAYAEILKNKAPQKKIIVAVIDGGVDIQHNDLKGKIWINRNEIADNGIDDDQNGYVDDINGWNFIGNSNGENINYENLEYVRIYKKLNSKYESVQNADSLNKTEQEEFALYMNCKEMYKNKLDEYTKMDQLLTSFEIGYQVADTIIRSYLKKDQYSIADLRKIKSAPEDVEHVKKYFLYLHKSGYSRHMFLKMREDTRSYLDYRLNTSFDARMILSDDPEDITDIDYGNNNVSGPSAEHGTFVAGIIAADRSNNIGIDGITNNVEIMALRAIPNGDEWDKDVALAIRYAVNNGAHIINMSFGKDYSPQKRFVDNALSYADEHNVLVIHAAGNNGENLDEKERYPTDNLAGGIEVKNWLSVGASTHKLNKDLCGVFSNYGSKEVGLFAPGVNIISLSPGNRYEMNDGTSFSCPVVSGVAALVWSYYPQLTALQLKNLLLNSTAKYPKQTVYYPNIKTSTKSKTRFSSLSATGGIINAYEALKLAETLFGVNNNKTTADTSVTR